MKSLLAIGVVMVGALAVGAQSVPVAAGSDWAKVVSLPVGTDVRIIKKHFEMGGPLIVPHAPHVDCVLVAASTKEVSCLRTASVFFIKVHETVHVKREDVASVRLTKEAKSALVGGLIGAGAGVAGAIGVSAGGSNHEDDSLVYLVFALLGGLVGAAVGRVTDFIGGPTIYRAP